MDAGVVGASLFGDDVLDHLPLPLTLEGRRLVERRVAGLAAGEDLPPVPVELAAQVFVSGPFCAPDLLSHASDPVAAADRALELALVAPVHPASRDGLVRTVFYTGVPSDGAVAALPFSLVAECAGPAAPATIRLLERFLGSDLSAWEAFWSLAASWDASFGALLETAAGFGGVEALLPAPARVDGVFGEADAAGPAGLFALDLLARSDGVPVSVLEGVWMAAAPAGDRLLLSHVVLCGVTPSPALLEAARSFVPADLRAVFMERWAGVEDVRSLWGSARSKRLAAARARRAERLGVSL